MIFWNFCWRAGRKREARVTVRIRVRVLFETKICLALKTYKKVFVVKREMGAADSYGPSGFFPAQMDGRDLCISLKRGEPFKYFELPEDSGPDE